jgi:methylated-DNA-[protein]-cysteine S-methyltransferase
MDNLRRSASSEEARWLGDEEGELQRDELLSALDQIYLAQPAARVEAALEKTALTLEAESGRMLYYDEVEAPLVGKLFLALSAAGLYALTFGGSEAAFLERLERSGRRTVIRDPGRVRPVAEKIQRYLAGVLSSIDVPVDMSGMTDFQRKVLGAVRGVPRGEYVTYGELAQRIGRPRAARAVGRALGSNPIPIVIPCHRVLAADGSLGGYSGRGGVRTKRALLHLEGAL